MPSIIIQQAVTNVDILVEPQITTFEVVLTEMQVPGADGLSAYEVAVENGFVGTEEEWLLSLKGDDGSDVTVLAEIGAINTALDTINGQII